MLAFIKICLLVLLFILAGCGLNSGKALQPSAALDLAHPTDENVGLYSFLDFSNPDNPREVVFIQSGSMAYLLKCSSPKLLTAFGFSTFDEPTMLDFSSRCPASSQQAECLAAREMLSGAPHGEHYRSLRCTPASGVSLNADFAANAQTGVYLLRYTDRPTELFEPGCQELLDALQPPNQAVLQTSLRHLPLFKQLPIHCKRGTAIVAPTKTMRPTTLVEWCAAYRADRGIEASERETFELVLNAANAAAPSLSCDEVSRRLQAVDTLSLANRNLKTVLPIRLLAGLKKLDVSANPAIADLHKLEGLNLVELNVEAAGAPATLDFVSSMSQLAVLKASRNAIQSLAALRGLSQLRQLEVAENAIADIAPLVQLKQLRQLNILKNPVAEKTAYTSFTEACLLEASITREDVQPKLQLIRVLKSRYGRNELSCASTAEVLASSAHIDVSNAQIASVDLVTLLPNVESFDVSRNQITDVAPFKDLRSLKKLDLRLNPIASLGALEGVLPWEQINLAGTPVLQNLMSRLASSSGIACAADRDNKLQCWTGNGDAGDLLRLAVDKLSALSLSSGGTVLCSLDVEGKLFCYGDTGLVYREAPSSDLRAKAIAVGDMHVCVIDATDALRCFMPTERPGLKIPDDVAQQKISMVRSMGSGVCALLQNGRLRCFGEAHDAVWHVPNDTFVDVAMGYQHICALNLAGDVNCWGRDELGQIRVPAGLKAKAVAAGSYHSCALLLDGHISCWGNNGGRQITYIPATPAIALAAGPNDVCAFLVDGKISCWGYGEADNIHRQLFWK